MEETFPTISTLNSLIATCRDGEEGYRLAAEEAGEHGPIEELCTRLSAQRGAFVHELQDLVRSLDAEPETASSFSGAAHRRWMDLRSIMSGGDEHALLEECERGEAAAVEAYRHALQQANLQSGCRQVIERQAAAVESAHDKVCALRDTAP